MATPGTIRNGYSATSPGGMSYGLTLEPGIKGSIPNGGYPEDRPIPLNDWRSATDAVLATTAGQTPYRALVDTSIPSITFRQDATTADIIRTSLAMPGQYDPSVDDLRLLVCARKSDTNDSENDTLGLQCRLRYFTPGQANPTIGSTTVPTAPAATSFYTPSLTGDTALTAVSLVARRLAPAANTNDSNFAFYEFNLGANGLKPCDIAILELGPTATVGSADLLVQVIATSLRLHRCASLFARDLRFSDSAIFLH